MYCEDIMHRNFRHTTKDGISSEIASCFLEDQKGFLWIGTDKVEKMDKVCFLQSWEKLTLYTLFHHFIPRVVSAIEPDILL